MSNKSVRLPVSTVQNFISDTFAGLGVSAEEARICSEVVITSDLRGIESHGIGRLKYYYDRIKSGQHNVITRLEIIRESPTTAVVDAHHGMGMITGTRSMQMAIDKAEKYGMGAVAVRNSTHFGIAGYYPTMAARAGMVGMAFTNARPSIAPTFGVQPKLGTNPIAFGCPSDEPFPFLFDAATSIAQRGKFEVYARAEKRAPEGWAVNQQGGMETDPQTVLTGLTQDTIALLPLGGFGEILGGHKGYGLAVIVEILCASLQSGAFLQDLLGLDSEGNKQHFMVGHFFMAIKIENFVPLVEFKHTTGEILRELRAARKAPGCDRIFTAGEKEYENEQFVRKHGIEVVPSLQKDIKFIQKELDLWNYDFPF
jgi:L-2-hydroxycarboxylate dehydrogenase (NAD+)